MFGKLMVPLFGSFVLFVPLPVCSQTPAPKPPDGQPSAAPGFLNLTGEDEKRAKELDEQIDKATKADRWDEAIAKAEELVALRARVQGPRHFETVSAEWRLKTLRRVAPMRKADRLAYQSVRAMIEQAETLVAQGKYAGAEPLFEKALEIRRRLLGDDHPETAASYNDLGLNFNDVAKTSEAQSLIEKGLAIRRRLLTDDHPDTAAIDGSVASNLKDQGKYLQAQPLFEKALEIHRRVVTDEHPGIAQSRSNLAMNLSAQGKYAEARDQWLRAVKTLDATRPLVAFTGLDRAASESPARLFLAGVEARLGQPAEAWQTLEQNLGRGLLDELAAR